jgi:hypothetical protein
MLDRNTDGCMVSIININNSMKEPAHGSQNCNTSQILIFGGCVKVRASLHTRVIIRDNTILYHIDARAFLPRYEGSCMVYRPKSKTIEVIKHPFLTSITKCELLIKDT